MAILLSVVYLACWIPSFISDPLNTGISLAITIANACLMMQICYKANLTRTHNFFPLLMYFIPISAISGLQTQWMTQIGVMGFLFTTIIIMSTYRQDRAQEQSFLCTLLLIGFSAALPDLIWFIPLLWIAFIIEQAFSLRTWMASVVAILTAAILIVAYYYAQNYITLPSFSLQYLDKRMMIDINNVNIAILAFAAIHIVFSVGIITNFSRDNVSVQSMFLLLTIAFLLSLGLLIAEPLNHGNTALVMLSCTAGVATHFFLGKQTVVRGSIFLAYILLTISYSILSYIFL